MDALNQITEFKGSQELLDKLSLHSIRKTYSAGKVILQEQAPISSIPIVTKGTLKVIRTDEDDREILLYYIQAGESCIMSLLGGLHNATSKIRAEVEDDAEVLFLPIDKVSLFIKEYPQWLEYIFRMYHQRFEDLLDVINALTFQKMDDRLLRLLRKKSVLTQSKTIHITHEQLATELATARVVISRILKQMEDNGLLILGRNKITLCN